MGTLKASIQLYDAISAPLGHINEAISTTVQKFSQLQAKMDKQANPSGLKQAGNAIKDSAESAGKKIKENTDQQNRWNNSINNSKGLYDELVGKIKLVGATMLSALGAKKVIDLSDELTSMTARLKLMNKGGEDIEHLQDRIFASANRSRGSYLSTINTVAALGQRAGDAFKNNSEIIQFAENLNKEFAIAGASQQEAAAASLQLTQALGSGVLRGDELNSVFEAAPNVIQTIADYLQVPIGEIRSMAAEGQISADVVKAAMLSATDQINQDFQSMPMTFSQVMTEIQNYAIKAFQPVLQQMNEIANSDSFQAMVEGIINNLQKVAMVATEVFGVIANVGGMIADNWGVIGPIIGAATTALIAFKGVAVVAMALEAIHSGIEAVSTQITKAHAAAEAMKGGATLSAAAATKLANGAQIGYNAALLACPITWVVLGFVMLIGILFAVVAIWNHFTGQAVSGIGIIVGAVYALWAIIQNVFIGLYDIALIVIEGAVNLFFLGVYNAQMLWYNFAQFVGGILVKLLDALSQFVNFMGEHFIALVNALGEAFYSISDGVLGVAAGVAGAIDGLVNGALAGIESLINGAISGINGFIGLINKIPGVNIGAIGSVSLGRSNMGGAVASLRSSIQKPQAKTWKSVDLGAGLAAKLEGMQAPNAPQKFSLGNRIALKDVGAAYQNGYAKGQAADNSLDNFLNKNKDAMDGMTGAFDDLKNQGVGAGDGSGGSGGGGGRGGGGGKGLKGIKDDTGAIRDALDYTDDQLKYLRDIAEQEVINRFTTADIKVDMTNNNNISNEMDLDGVINYLTLGLQDAMGAVAEGV